MGWLLTFVPLMGMGCDAIFDLEKVNYTPPPPCEPLDVATGRHHTCAIDYRGDVRCWGDNEQGEVLPGAADVALQPLQVALPAPAAQVVVGRHHSCARLTDGAVWCWGTNDDNQLALGPGVDSDAPVPIPGLPPSAEISSGGYHVCSRSREDAQVWCWGSNGHLESGQPDSPFDCDPDDDTLGACILPTVIPSTAGTKALALGHRFSCLIDADDRVRCWGQNNGRQLAIDEETLAETHTPTLITQIGAATAIGASGRTVCAVETSGLVKCWGRGSDGQLATGAFASESSAPVGTLVDNARSAALSNGGGCAVLRDGKVECWGNSDTGTGTFVTTPTPQTALLTNASQVSGGFFHQCAIANGELACWGNNSEGQLGRGAQSVAKVPVTTIASGVTQVAAGDHHACAIANGELYCWGDNDYGQAGDPSFTRTYVPTKRETNVLLIGVAAGFDQTCVWGAGSAECWGRAWAGRLGNGDDVRSQERTAVLATGIDHIGIGGDHMCALLQDNTIRCFGHNGKGQLGLDPTQFARSLTGTTVTASTAPGFGTIFQVVAGERHTCARTSTGVWCWGRGGDGQLGYGGIADQYIPHQVPSFLATDLAAGEDHTCAIEQTSGDVYCWGRNANGQLGNNSRTSSANRQRVMNLPARAVRVYSGTHTSTVCAVLETGATYCWGDGDVGQLGNDILSDRSLPAPAPGFALATAVAVGGVGTCAVVGGAVKCVGEWRMLGNGDQSLSVPTAVDLGIGACPLD